MPSCVDILVLENYAAQQVCTSGIYGGCASPSHFLLHASASRGLSCISFIFLIGRFPSASASLSFCRSDQYEDVSKYLGHLRVLPTLCIQRACAEGIRQLAKAILSEENAHSQSQNINSGTTASAATLKRPSIELKCHISIQHPRRWKSELHL